MLKRFLLILLIAVSAQCLSLTAPLHKTTTESKLLQERIIGGEEVSIVKHSYLVSLRARSCVSCPYTHYCGGSILNENVIITAAHCVAEAPLNVHDLIVVAGTNVRNGANGVVMRVSKFIVHEKYNVATSDNDIALIYLSTALPINNATIAPVVLAAHAPKINAKATVAGWGRTSESGMYAAKLEEVEVPIVSKASCIEAYEYDHVIADSMLCAGSSKGGKDACRGDSGGPLLVNRELVGIVSWGTGCARPNYPGVYADVAFLKSWIEDTVKKNVI